MTCQFMKKKIFFLVIVIYTLFFVISFVNAGLGIIPSSPVEFSLMRGESLEGFFVVKNQDNKFLGFEVTVSKRFKTEGSETMNVEEWIVFDKDKYLFTDQQDSMKVKYTVHVPTAAAGELMVMVSFKPISKENRFFTPVTSLAMYVSVKGTENFDGEITNFSVIKTDKGLLPSVEIKNSGNVHFRPRGNFSIYKKKKKILELPIKYGWPVQPGKSRVFVAASNMILEKGRYKVKINIYYKNKNILDTRVYKLKVKKSEVIIDLE